MFRFARSKLRSSEAIGMLEVHVSKERDIDMPRFAVSCFSCGEKVAFERSLGRTDTCPDCDADLKVCKTCRHHDRSAPQQCREPTAEFVSNKERANFCGLYEPSATGADLGPGPSPADDAKARLEALFKK
jgi:predicted RNA-binding Zn-ribbon protein involved in translation (DUF1610 family)